MAGINAGSIDVLVKFLGDAAPLNAEIRKVQSTGSKLTGWAKTAGSLIAGAFAVKTVASWVDEADKANAVNKKLEQSLRNAGDATGEWAKHAEKLTDAMQHKVGIDDETIKNSLVLLSTFHGITGTLKDQPALFDRATNALVDLSAAGFGSTDAAAKALGKALEDPTKGLTALKKAGIQFTDAQKAQIKAFIDAGDKASAYNLILSVVEGKVKGVGEASATSGQKLSVAWNEAKEQLGNALLPVLQQVTPWLESMAHFVELNANWLVPATIGVIGLVAALKAWIAAQGILNGLLATFGVEEVVVLGPLALIAAGVFAVAAAGVYLAVKWDAVWSGIANLPWYVKVIGAILLISNPIVDAILLIGLFGHYWSQVWEAVKQTVEDVAGAIVAAIQRIKDAINTVLGPLQSLGGALAGGGGAGFIPKATGGSSSGVHIGHFATGGIVTRPTLAMIGEAGPEAVVPLSGRHAGSGSVVVVNVTTTGLGADSAAIQRDVATTLRNYISRNGPI